MEEIKANNADILKLRELHEQLIEPLTKKLKRKRKDETKRALIYNENVAGDAADASIELDASILQGLAEEVGGEESDDNDSDNDSGSDNERDDNKAQLNTLKINSKARRSKKIDTSLEVSVLDANFGVDDILSNYKLSKEAKKFQSDCFNEDSRIKFTRFKAQKKIGPAKIFALRI